MYDEQVILMCGEGEPMDRYTAAALGLVHHIQHDNDGHPTLNSPQPNNSDKGRHGWSAFMFAIYYQRKPIIKYFASSAPQYSQTENSPGSNSSGLVTTPLSLAVLSGDLSSVQLLSPMGNLDEQDSRNKTALWWAVETNQVHIASLLLTQGASPNVMCEGESCIGVAGRQGNATLMELLLKHGADACFQEPAPLILAMESGNLRTIALLLKHVLYKHGFEEMLRQVKLDKFLPVFQTNNIQYQQFINMTENDLKNCGISQLGPRKKLGLLISLLKSNK